MNFCSVVSLTFMQHFIVFFKWNIDEIIQTFIPSDLNISINIHCCPKQYIKTVHFLKISKTTWTKSPYIIPNYVNEDTWVVYEYRQSHICGGQWGAIGSHMTGGDVTGSHVTGRDHVRSRKYAMRMRNWTFRNTLSGFFTWS